jgi:polar amino acid transport system substrate-binding protein
VDCAAIASAKDRHQLTKAVQGALYDLFDGGTYDELLKKWQMLEGSLKTGAINGGA